MAISYAVHRGTTANDMCRVTENPALALQWGRTSGPLAYVVRLDSDGPKRIVWTPTHESRNLGILQQTVLDLATAAAVAVTG